MDADEKTIEIILEANEKHYNLTLILVTIVPWLVCLVCGALAVYGLLWLIGVFQFRHGNKLFTGRLFSGKILAGWQTEKKQVGYE